MKMKYINMNFEMKIFRTEFKKKKKKNLLGFFFFLAGRYVAIK